MYFLDVTATADEEITSVIEYIVNVLKVPMAADNLVDAIEKQTKTLQEMPYIYPFVPDDFLASKGLKFVKVKNYRLFYIIDEEEKTVNVIRFLYGRMDWKNRLKEQLFC
jgi:toxin ParE1/3/4